MRLITLLTTAAAIIPYTIAAECWEKYQRADWLLLEESDAWKLRERMCGQRRSGNYLNNICGKDRTAAFSEYLRGGAANNHCWEATENIIVQCFRNGKRNGIWRLGDEFYGMYARPAIDGIPADCLKTPEWLG